MAPNNENATFPQKMKDSSLCQPSRLMLIKVRNGALARRDVKNEGTSGDVYENKGAHDTMPDNSSAFLAKKCKNTR
jgi:hypothetical protein